MRVYGLRRMLEGNGVSGGMLQGGRSRRQGLGIFLIVFPKTVRSQPGAGGDERPPVPNMCMVF
mgnify:CR=1 FL=1